MSKDRDIVPWIWGAASAAALLVLTYLIIGALQGFAIAGEQFTRYFAYRVALTVGFGIVVGLSVRIRRLSSAAAVAPSAAAGGTSAGAMLACCSHYLPTILPFAAVGGFAAFIGQYQSILFGIGLVTNVAGILYLSRVLHRMKNQL